jgi:CDP-glucose 4,6-dehydratase
MFDEYKGRRVFVTGHTGFKGSWLALWLRQKGATVAGMALPPEKGRQNLFKEACVGEAVSSVFADIRDFSDVEKSLMDFEPEIIFHLAAQALVRRSYNDPIGTFGSNVMGTAHVLEAARRIPSVKAIVCVTTDKVYRNHEREEGYREDDELGGKDPYSASKACAELVAAVYMQTLFPLSGEVALATARGGNVVGGGDWSEDRLIPDIVRSVTASEDIVLRNPRAIRPWQHVLELCSGYLQLGNFLLENRAKAIGAWNFGPDRENEVEVEVLAKDFIGAWGLPQSRVRVEPTGLPEAGILKLDNTKAWQVLGWRPVLGYHLTLRWTAEWYSAFHEKRRLAIDLVKEQIQAFEELASR